MVYKGKKIIGIFLIVFLVSVFLANLKSIEKYFFPTKYEEYVEKYSDEYGIDKYLVYSIIKTESKFDPNAISSKGAKGLMQLTDVTSKWAFSELRIKDGNVYDPETNIRAGVWFLSRLYKEFDGDLKLIIPAYNAGAGNVKRWLRTESYSSDGKSLVNIPFMETSKYRDKVLINYEKYKYLYKK